MAYSFMKAGLTVPYHNANVWADAPYFDDQVIETKYAWIRDHETWSWNHMLVLKLIVNKCNWLQYQIDQMGPADIDMGMLLLAMLSAESDQIRTFIGIVDAYRLSVWNKPFNAEYYAAIARGFT